VNRWRARLGELQANAAVSLARVQNVQNVQNSSSVPSFEHFEQIERPPKAGPSAQNGSWSDAEEERAAIAEYDGGAPRRWAEGFARLDPAHPPGDVPMKRWLQFIDDCGRFLDEGWACRAEDLGWGPLDLFGCDRERPVARVDHLGLLWLVRGGRILKLLRDRAILKTTGGALQSYRRRPVEVGRVVIAWELVHE
jgi:hypothetical protein